MRLCYVNLRLISSFYGHTFYAKPNDVSLWMLYNRSFDMIILCRFMFCNLSGLLLENIIVLSFFTTHWFLLHKTLYLLSHNWLMLCRLCLIP